MDCSKLVGIDDDEEFGFALELLLNSNSDRLPLEDECKDGGFPDPMSIEVYGVTRTGEDKATIYARFGVTFTETINTSCGDVTIEKNRNATCSVEIDKEFGRAEITVEECDSDEEEPEF